MLETLFDLDALLATEERAPHRLRSADPEALARLFTVEELSQLCWQLGPELAANARMVRRGELFPQGRRAPLEWVQAGLAAGATLVLDDVGRRVVRLGELAHAIEARLGYHVQLNAYLTPPDARGNDVHFDTHDVIILQIAGAKSWSVWSEGPITLPVLPQRRVLARSEVGTPEGLILEAGDVLYLPRGVPHEAETRGAWSLHVSIGLHPPLIRDALSAVVDLYTLEEEALRGRARGSPDALVAHWQALAADPARLRGLAERAIELAAQRRAPTSTPLPRW